MICDMAAGRSDIVEIIASESDDTQNDQDNAQDHPWPYLEKYFQFKVKKKNSLKFLCKLCLPKHNEISAYINSPSNLQKHVKKKHPRNLEEYTSLTSIAKKHKCAIVLGQNIDEPKQKQAKLTMEQSSSKKVSQQLLDGLTVDLITQGLLPFKFVELPAFKKLVTTLQPRLHVMSRPTLKRRLKGQLLIMKQTLLAALSNIEFVATTTDCWTARRKSFLGLTVHWIDADFRRQSAALACHRLKGSHTFDVLTAAIDDIHSEYEIRSKVIATTTDNGSNFVKAFTTFCDNASVTEDESQPSTSSDAAAGEDSDQNAGSDDDFESATSSVSSEIQYTNVSDIFSCSTSLQYKLPKHIRCACHTLHLVASKDMLQAESNVSFKKLHRACFAKLNALWNKIGRSPIAAEIVERCCQMQLIKPNQTRWNSLFLSVERMIKIYKDSGEGALRQLFQEFHLRMLTVVEIEFLQEYCKTMKPLSRALDILQSEKSCFMGFLLPTLYELCNKLEKVQLMLNYCGPLASAILHGIHVRFESMMTNSELIAAAILIPQFKTEWTSKRDVIEKGIEFIKRKVESMEVLSESSSTTSEEDEEEFFASFKRKSSKGAMELEGYLSIGSRDLTILASFPTLEKLSKMLNTPLPASAACERLFSVAGQIFTPKRANTDSLNFESQLLLKLNSKYC